LLPNGAGPVAREEAREHARRKRHACIATGTCSAAWPRRRTPGGPVARRASGWPRPCGPAARTVRVRLQCGAVLCGVLPGARAPSDRLTVCSRSRQGTCL
jgi:hypothetical protein